MFHNLIIGLAGPYGSGCSSVASDLEKIISERHCCHVRKVKASDLIIAWHAITQTLSGETLKEIPFSKPERRQFLQQAGNDLRVWKESDLEFVGKIISLTISISGTNFEKRSLAKSSEDNTTLVYIVDSLKNTNEVNLLRRVYGNEFFLCFVHADRESRWRRMKNYESWEDKQRLNFEDMDLVDCDEGTDYGQQVRKIAAMADYYLVNDGNRDDLEKKGRRLVSLFFDSQRVLPTPGEGFMHIAFSAATNSCCLRRQVGAAIVGEKGSLLSIGYNDAPKYGGGLYQTGDISDWRCRLVGNRACINDTNKKERFKKLSQSIHSVIENVDIEKIETEVEKSDFKDSTEYCRAVHAEMASLMNICRTNGETTFGSTMYVTLQPCHTCTKHIISAGLIRVVYIEPYPKSLGEELHGDAIVMDPSKEEMPDNKVAFVHYEGIDPHRFHDFYVASSFSKLGKEYDDNVTGESDSTTIGGLEKSRLAYFFPKRERTSSVKDKITFLESEISSELIPIVEKFIEKTRE